MIILVPVYRYLRQIAPIIVPFGLWAMLWLSIQSGGFSSSYSGMFESSSPFGFFNAARGLFPLLAIWAASIIILVKLSQQKPRGFRFFGPLGLTVVYGLVGVIAAVLSPDWNLASYWALLYLSVPLVLWATVWGAGSLGSISRLVNFNWFLILTGMAVLFFIALVNFDIGSKLLSPSSLWKCEQLGSWFALTSGYIRSTGVGRFAAITAIICFSMLWRANRWRTLWIVALYVSLVFLMTTGARTSILGVAAAAPLIAVLHWGKKAVIIGILALAILTPVAWNTGLLQTFLQSCILRAYDPAGITYLNIQTPEPDSSFRTTVQPTQEQSAPPDQPASSLSIPASSAEANLNAPDRSIILRRIDGEGKADSESSTVIVLPAGELSLKQIFPSDEVPSKDSESPPVRIQFPPGVWAIESQQANSTDPPTSTSQLSIQDGIWVVELVPSFQGDSQDTSAEPASQDNLVNPEPGTNSQTPNQSNSEDLESPPVRIQIPSGIWVIESQPAKSTDPPTLTSQLSIQDGIWVVELVPSIQEDSRDTPAELASHDSLVKPDLGTDGQNPKQSSYLESALEFLPLGFLHLSGRTLVWAAGWEFIKLSPILGYGFHGDRLVLGTHIHNAIMHAMIQTGLAGTIPFVGALLLGWMLVLKAIRRLNQLPETHKLLVIQTTGILAFLSIRGVLESTGAFFGIDWLLLAPLLLYIQVITSRHSPMNAGEGA